MGAVEWEATGRLTGVGVGPGDPELVTRKAVRAIEEADRVVAPTIGPDAPGRAESIVRQACPGVRIHRLAFEMSREHASGPSGAAVPGQTGVSSYQRAATTLVQWLKAGEDVAFVTLGDPNIYSTFSSLAVQVKALSPSTRGGTVPGIMAFQDLASRSEADLLDGTESLNLVPAPQARADSAVGVYKGARRRPAVAKRLADAGRLEGAVMGELMGLPGERVAALADHSSEPASYLVTVIVPPRDGR